MSYETDRQKLKKINNNTIDNNNLLESITLIQNQRETQISLCSPRLHIFSKFQYLASEWITMNELMYAEGTRGYGYKFGEFKVVIESMPENYIPYARLNMVWRQTGSENVFPTTAQLVFNQVLQVIDIPNSKFKKVIFNIGVMQEVTIPNSSYDVKFKFAMLNPLYITAS